MMIAALASGLLIRKHGEEWTAGGIGTPLIFDRAHCHSRDILEAGVRGWIRSEGLDRFRVTNLGMTVAVRFALEHIPCLECDAPMNACHDSQEAFLGCPTCGGMFTPSVAAAHYINSSHDEVGPVCQ